MKQIKLLIIFSSVILFGFTIYLVKTHIKPYNITSVLDRENPVYIRYQEHLQKYNDENDVYLLLESPESLLHRADFSKLIFETAERLKWVPNLDTVASLQEAEYLVVDNKRSLLKRFFVENKLSDQAQDLLKNSPVFQYSYLSPDEKASIIYVSLRNDLTTAQNKQVFKDLNEIKSIIEKDFRGVKAHLLGTEIARNYFVQEITKSQARILPIVLSIILFMLFMLFRSMKVCALAFYVMGISYFCTVCLVVLLEGSINPFSSFALLFVLIISTADIVHLFSAVSHLKEKSIEQRFKLAIADIWRPCLICAITTWIGLLSLVVADIPPIRYFGIYCAFGISICFFLTFYGIPWLVKIFEMDFKFEKPWLNFAGIHVLAGVKRWRRFIVAAFALVMFGFGYLSMQLEAGDNIYKKFVKSHPLTQAAEAFEKYFNFTGSIDLVLSRPRAEFLSLGAEKKLEEIQRKISSLRGVAHIKSIANYHKYIRSLFPKKAASADFQTDDELNEIFNLFEDNEVMKSYLPPGYSETRLSIYLTSMDTKTLLSTKAQIEEIMRAYESDKEFTWSIEGFSNIRAFIYESIFNGFLKSFLFDFIGIFLCFLFFWRSFFWSVLALIPNALPLVACGGLMKILAMSVDYNLIVLVAIIFGIAVDDTTHFMYYLLQDYRKNGDVAKSMAYSFDKTSIALVSTTFIFAVTLPVFFLTDILMFSQVAIILILSLILGLAGDIFVLPALLYSRRLGQFIKWKDRFATKEMRHERS